jgi:hypothetical protein
MECVLEIEVPEVLLRAGQVVLYDDQVPKFQSPRRKAGNIHKVHYLFNLGTLINPYHFGK